MRGKSMTCRNATTRSLAVFDRRSLGLRPGEEKKSARQVLDLPRIGVAEPELKTRNCFRGKLNIACYWISLDHF